MGKILLAEDEKILRTMINDSLSHFNHEVDEAENGEIAWKLWNSNQYDLLITDINMPLLGGIDLLKRIREKDAYFPVIMMTGVFFESVDDQIKDSDVSALLLKPFKLKDLIQTIEKILNRL